MYIEPINLLRGLESSQYAFVFAEKDGKPATRVSYLSHRDGGKTYGALSYALYLTSTLKNIRCRYFGPTYASTVDTAWPVVHELIGLHGLDKIMECTIGNLTVMCSTTGSALKCYGADQERLHDRFRGPHDTALIILDECQSWESDIEPFVDRVLAPTLIDDGRIFLLGTPGEREGTYFHRVTSGQIKSYTPITGEYLGNRHSRKRIMARIAEAKEANPDVESEPWFQREYYGRWVSDNRLLEYKLNPAVNYCYELPMPLEQFYYHLLFIDWGYFPDPTARVFAAATPQCLYFLDAEEQLKPELEDHLQAIYRYRYRFPGLIIVADPGGAPEGLVDTLRSTYAIPIINAEKAEKYTAIEVWNKDASIGKMKVCHLADQRHPEDSLVSTTLNTLTWVFNRRTGGREEGKPRHVADCCLYGHRYWRKEIAAPEPQRFDRPKKPRYPDESAYLAAQEQEMMKGREDWVKQRTTQAGRPRVKRW